MKVLFKYDSNKDGFFNKDEFKHYLVTLLMGFHNNQYLISNKEDLPFTDALQHVEGVEKHKKTGGEAIPN